VWGRIWAVLSDFFVETGCHHNLQVAMFAVDSLRQLAMKFLERDEMANFSFQNDFLKPFVVVMRQSRAVEIRELIIRCSLVATPPRHRLLSARMGACQLPDGRAGRDGSGREGC
jgi:Sec7-like guanine-nucleotide exchange factor